MNFPVSAQHQRLVDQVDGWLELRCPERALELITPLVNAPEDRSMGLALRVRANARLGNYQCALEDLATLRHDQEHNDWIDLTEAWCRRRNDDLAGAIRCIEGLLSRNQRHDTGHFNLACYLALAGEQDRAIDELSLACGLNPDCRTFALDEPDFDSLRSDERFRQLLRPRDEPA
jgi:tetratricopeptide (TPR) repeat protein